MSLPLSALFARSLAGASRASVLPTADDSVQKLIESSLRDLTTLTSRIAALSLFSPNETAEDIATFNLVYLLVPYVLSEVRGRLNTVQRENRIILLRQTQKDLKGFISSLEDYEIVPKEEQAFYHQNTPITNATKRREIKIEQYQKEKALQARIETVYRRKSRLPSSDEGSTEFDIISSLLPPTGKDEEPSSENEDTIREATLLFLRFKYSQSHTRLENADQELELLLNAPPTPLRAVHLEHPNNAETGSESDNITWKLDIPLAPGGQGPLLDPSGKPLRPFTILPSNTTAPSRLRSRVFGPDYRLPTMSIDEYLEIERQRGNVIAGGGPSSQIAPTSSEQLTLDAEADGTRDGEEKAEIRRQKEETWARFTDENPRGAGNTMNRG